MVPPKISVVASADNVRELSGLQWDEWNTLLVRLICSFGDGGMKLIVEKIANDETEKFATEHAGRSNT
jgi:hypothetical protein